MALETKNYEGQYGNRSHITRVQTGTVPTHAVANLMGARGEVPGEHRNKLDDRWDEFKSDIHQNGIREPIFITVDPGKSPVINEGNHRRDAAVELGLHEIPAEIRYYGHSELDRPHFASIGWRTTMAVDPAWFQKYMEQHGPYGWHVTGPGNLESIEREGIKYDPDRLDTGIGGNIPDRNYLFTGDQVHSAPFRVDLRKLDPNLFGIDEDAVHLHHGWEPIDSNDRDRLPEFLQQHPELDSPEYVQKSMETDPHSVAYMGDIPPEAIERNPSWWADEKNQRAIQEHNKWQESLQDVVRQHEEQQKFLGTGGIVGRHGEHGWDADGNIYKIIPPDAKYPHGLHIEQRPAPEEVYDAMQASGVEPSWMREWKTKFPELFKAGATGWRVSMAQLAPEQMQELTQHIEQLAKLYGIGITWSQSGGLAEAGMGDITIPRIETDHDYLAALHEIGHIAAHQEDRGDVKGLTGMGVAPHDVRYWPYSQEPDLSAAEHDLEDEAATWRWAAGTSKIPVTPEMWHQVHQNSQTYMHEAVTGENEGGAPWYTQEEVPGYPRTGPHWEWLQKQAKETPETADERIPAVLGEGVPAGRMAATGADQAGAMVAIYPPPQVAKQLAVENGEAPEQLHITLAYFEAKAADHTPQEWDEAGEVVTQVAKDHGPIDVKIGGVAQFDSPEGKPTPVVGTVDAPGLAELHVALKDALTQAGFPLNEEHGFNPHLTYTYLEDDEEAPEIEGNAEWTADQIVLVVGGDRQPYNLGGADASNMLPKAAGSDPQRFIAWLNRVALTASTKYSAVPYEDSVKAVQSVLTPDLLHKKYRDNPRAHCYIASEALYHMLGGPAAGLTPMNIVHEGSQHWFLRGPNGEIIDPTHGQFENPVPYENARGRGFLTAQPSKRAAEIIRRVQERKAWYVSDQEKGTHVPVVIIPGTGYVMGNPGDDHRPLEEQLLQAGYRQGDWTQARVNSGVLPDGPYHEVVPNTIDPELQERIKAEAAERLRTHDFRTSAERAYYYHMAPTEERQRIQTHGIQPANPLYGEGWSQLRGPRGGTPSWFKRQPTGVYVFGNPRDAEDSRTWFGSDDGYNLRKMDMWRIPREAVQQIDQDKHVWKNEGKEAYVIPHAVQAEMHLPYEQSSAADTYLDKMDRALGNKPQYDWMPAYPTTERDMKAMGIGFPDRVIGKTAFDEAQHPRGYGGKWVAKHDQHEVKVHDTKGKHKSTIKRCRHCGSLYERKTDHKGRIGCPTCGLDPERHLHVTKVAAATDPVDTVAQSLGWTPARTTANGHTMYGWTDDLGNPHLVTAAHHHIPERQARYARTQMTACMNGACAHPKVNIGAPLMDEPGAPVLRAGQEVQYGGGHWWIMDIDGELAHIYDEKGAEDIVPTRQLRAAGWHFADEDLAERVRDFNEGDHPDTDPDYVFVYYQGKLEMQPYPASYRVMADELLKSYGYDVLNYDDKLDTGVDPDWVTGEVWNGREIEFSIKQLSDPESVEAAEAAVKEVLRGKTAGWVTVADLG